MNPQRPRGARRPAEAVTAMLKTLSGAIKLISLYQASHPMPTQAVEQAWKLLQQLHGDGGQDLAIGFAEGRWIVSDTALGEASQTTEALAAMFRALELRTVLFQPGVQLFEVAAFCKLAVLAAGSARPVDPAAYFKQAGVKHILFDASVYSRVVTTAKPASAAAPVTSPIPAADAAKPAAAPSRRAGACRPSRFENHGNADNIERYQINVRRHRSPGVRQTQ